MSPPYQPGQSPDPETQTGSQQKDPPSDGKGVNPGTENKDSSNNDIGNLSSNPKGPLDDHVADTAKKTVDNATANSKN